MVKNSHDWSALTGFGKEFLIMGETMPDSRPFLSRIGVIDLAQGPKNTNSWAPSDIHWFKYDEIFIKGVPTNPNIN